MSISSETYAVTVDALVEAMSGRIWATPRPEGGSEFGFVLERYAEDDVLGHEAT